MKFKEILKNKELLEKEVPIDILKMLGLEKKKVFEVGEQYYYISDASAISKTYWDNDYADIYRLKHNNAFHTKEEAEFEFEKREVIVELREFAEKNNTEEINWENTNQKKWYIYYDYGDKAIWAVFCAVKKNMNDIYFTSKELVEQAVKTVGEDRIKKYLFGVE